MTITPTPGFVGEVTVSVAQFEDMEKPVAKEYVPLLKSQRLAVYGLDGYDGRRGRRDARITDGREVLTVETAAAADTTSVKALGLAAYETRTNDADDADGAGKNGILI